jgi:hypothetical protein
MQLVKGANHPQRGEKILPFSHFVDIDSDILSGFLFGIRADICFDILSGFLFGIRANICFDILSGILPDIYFDMLSGILFDIPAICFDNVFWHST